MYVVLKFTTYIACTTPHQYNLQTTPFTLSTCQQVVILRQMTLHVVKDIAHPADARLQPLSSSWTAKIQISEVQFKGTQHIIQQRNVEKLEPEVFDVQAKPGI